jgi:BirA family transcriptional regulator, biotin operon repressor / biotin---[acetyl-CoA-carboxylase] ligase
MKEKLVIWRDGEPDLAESIDPDSLAAAHDGWAADMRRCAPWLEEEGGVGRVFVSQTVVPTASVTVTGPCSSSLDVAWRFMGQGGMKPWESVLAVSQWAGRGQLRRDWRSPPGNVYAALAWPGISELSVELPPDLTPLCVGLVLAMALDEVLGSAQDSAEGVGDCPENKVKLKWPNDLILAEHKVGGILVEERGGTLMAGIGLNLAWMPGPDLLRDSWSVPAGRLGEHMGGGNPLPGPVLFWTRLVEKAKSCYESVFAHKHHSEIIELIQGRLAWLEQAVAVTMADGERLHGRIVGLSPDGGLRIDCNGDERMVRSGSVARQ